jgi:hypothetical protein
MKRIGIIGTTTLFLLVGMGGPANARQEKQDEKAKPQKQEQRAKPENKQQQAQAPKQQQDNSARQQQQAKPQKQQQQAQAPKQQQDKSSKQGQPQQARSQQNQQHQQRQQRQTASSQRPQRSQQDQDRQRAYPALRLSARGSGRIPDDRFRSNFGREHSFRIGEPVMVGGYSRFQYGGYWFGFAEPWPVGWYYTDDVYIDYVDGGYYMYDPYYPGARFAISVVI